MNIGRDNYESYFMDYLDGKLDTAEVEVLMSFLEFNPDLKQELVGLENVSLEPREQVFEYKAGLRKPVDTPVRQAMLENFEDYCISGIEQQLSPNEENMLQEIINDDPEKQNIYMLYRSTTLVADNSILYPGKSRLKRRYIDIPRLRIAMSSVAAVALILLALSWFFRNTQEQDVITESGSEPSLTQEAVEPVSIPAEKASNKPNDIKPVVKTPEPVVNFPVDVNFPVVTQKIRDESLIPEAVGRTFIPDPILLARIDPIQAEDLSEPAMENGISMVYHLRGTEFDDYLSLQKYAMQQFSRTIRDPRERKISLWKLASAGIQRINEFSEEDYSLDRKTDEYGKTRWLTLETPLFGISAPMKNPGLSR